VALEAFYQYEKPFETLTDLDEYDETPDNGQELDESSSSEDSDDDQAQHPDSAKIGDKFSSPEELMQAYKTAESQMMEKAREAEEYRSMLDQMGRYVGLVLRQAQEEAFIHDMRESFQKDPVAATAMMIKKFQEGSQEDVEARIAEAVQDRLDFRRLFEEFLNDPANSRLRPYEQELEYLIRSKGFFPDEAAELLRSVESKLEIKTKRRSAAAKEVRNQAAVESGGEINESVDKDKEFYRLMKKAKTLDEMFAALRKTKF